MITHFQITGTPRLDSLKPKFSHVRLWWPKVYPDYFAGFVAHPVPSWGGWWTSTASPGNQPRNFHGVWWHIQKWRTWISWTRWHQHPNPKPICFSAARCSLVEKMVRWYLDWSNHSTIKLKSLRDKLGKWSDWLTDVRDKWSLWKLIGCQTKLAQSKWKLGTWCGDTPWDPQAKCRY